MEVKGVVVVEDSGPSAGSGHAGCLRAREHVANRPIVHHVLDALQSAGVSDVVVASSAELAADVRECLGARDQVNELHVRYVQQRPPLDIAGALRLAAPIIGDAPCIVHLANGLLSEPLEPVMHGMLGDAPDVVLVMHHGGDPDEHLSPATQELLNLAELDRERAALSMAGVCLFGPEALRHASAAAWRVGTDVDLTMVAERIADAGGHLRVLPVNAWSRYAGDALDLLELNQIALDRLGSELHRTTNNGNRIEGRVLIHERALVRESVIVGPTIIGPGAQISDAYVGPYTSIGAGARIEGAEIERSIVAAGASIMHVGGRLVASVVGRDARIFRDFSLPRALRLRVGDGTVVALC
jgi:glucose-1-phosphate thymidylyltransferase